MSMTAARPDGATPNLARRILGRLSGGGVLGALAAPFRRAPDFVITKAGMEDRPYLKRWWIIPRNGVFNIYLHQILRSDDDRALHDHPWWNASIILKGGYVEITPPTRDDLHWLAASGFTVDTSSQVARDLAAMGRPFVRRVRKAGSIVFRKATAAHRLEIERGVAECAWTLFITGPRIRTWGFLCPQGFVPWQDFVDNANTGAVGRGCGEP